MFLKSVLAVHFHPKMSHNEAGHHDKDQIRINRNQTQLGASHIKQFLFLRRDLEDFSTGALVAQGSHASVAVLEKTRKDIETTDYLTCLEDMTTVVYGISEGDIGPIVKDLDSLGAKYHLWLENRQAPTCIATAPVDLSQNKRFDKFRRKFKLF